MKSGFLSPTQVVGFGMDTDFQEHTALSLWVAEKVTLAHTVRHGSYIMVKFPKECTSATSVMYRGA